LASGSEPSKIPIKGLEEVGFLGFHTLADCRRLLRELRTKTEVTIYGGGLVATEVAMALLERGCKVQLVVRSRILRSYFDNEAGGLIEQLLMDGKCKVFKGSTVSEIRQGKEKIEIVLSNGTCLESEIFVNAVGVKARTSFLEGIGLKGEKGVLVDSRMRTNLENIYAAGDVAEAPDFFFRKPGLRAILPSAVDEGRIAGTNMAGGKIEYKGSIGYNVCNFLGRVGFSGGLAMAESGEYEIYKEKNMNSDEFKKLVFKEDKLLGAAFLNCDIDAGVFRYLIENEISCEGCKEMLFDKPGDVSRWLMLNAEEQTNKAFRA
jgi:phenylglyoxylate dehydrogenase epsilon subunit